MLAALAGCVPAGLPRERTRAGRLGGTSARQERKKKGPSGGPRSLRASPGSPFTRQSRGGLSERGMRSRAGVSLFVWEPLRAEGRPWTLQEEF